MLCPDRSYRMKLRWWRRSTYVTVSSRRSRWQPRVEQLETRAVPTTAFRQTNLVADTAGTALVTDPNLINPWGIALNPTLNVFWMSDNRTGVSTLYDGNGQPAPAGSPLIVTVPASNSSPAGTRSRPTGIVFNSGSGFV